MKTKDVIAGSIRFEEDPASNLTKGFVDLMTELSQLRDERDKWQKVEGKLPELKRSISKLTDKKNTLESEISTMIVDKATIINDRVEEATREAHCLKEEVEKTIISLKSGLFSYEEKLKVKVKEADAIEDKVEKAKNLLSTTVDIIKQKRLESLEETEGKLAEVKEARSNFEQEKLSFNKEEKVYRENLAVLEKMSGALDCREKLLNELEATLNVEKSQFATEKEASEKRFSDAQESQKLTQESLVQGQEKLKKAQEDLVSFKKRLLVKEEAVLKREKDLDENWTVYEKEKTAFMEVRSG